jgi:hypothetical protein
MCSSKKARVFVRVKLFKPSIMCVGKVRAYLSEAPFRLSLWGTLLALLTNITLGWKTLQGRNTLAYYENP